MAVNDLAVFYRLTKLVDEDEQALKNAKDRLAQHYDMLVKVCPHSEAVDYKSSLRGVGVTRICKICGIEDHASEGGTPGDEYNYGYPGSPNRAFWAGADIETVEEKNWWQYRRSHNWRVVSGEAKK